MTEVYNGEKIASLRNDVGKTEQLHDKKGNCTNIQKLVGEWNSKNWVSPNEIFWAYCISRDDKQELKQASHGEAKKKMKEEWSF